MADGDFRTFQKEIVKLGFYSYEEQQSVWKLAQRCARTSGLATGTAACTAGSILYKEQIRKLLEEGS